MQGIETPVNEGAETSEPSLPLVGHSNGDPVGMPWTQFRDPQRAEDYRQQAADISVLRSSQERLRGSEARLQAAVDLVGLGCYSWHPETNTLEWDARVKAMWGLPPEAAIDYEMFIGGIHPEDRARVEAAIARCADCSGDGVYDVEYRVIGVADKVERWVATRGRTSFDDGKPSAFFGVALDITERKRAEAELRRFNETLEQRVAARAAELDEANRKLRAEMDERARAELRLQELQSELFHAARLSAMGQMAGALAHELSQPLGAAANFGNAARRLLASGDPDKLDKIRGHINAAVTQVLRAGRILHRLRDFVGQRDSDKRIANVEQIIADASTLALVGPQVLAVKVSYQLDPEVSLVFVDEVQIQQVLVNLMRNAIEAMAESPRRSLTVTTRLLAAEMVEIDVADTGPGLRGDLVTRLFQPFVTTKRRGMGLGLSICRTIVEAHGGRLWREPNPIGGTIFRFSLPAAPGDR